MLQNDDCKALKLCRGVGDLKRRTVEWPGSVDDEQQAFGRWNQCR